MQRAARSSLALASLTWVGLAWISPAWAVYKVVGPDGRITYTDRAPEDKAVDKSVQQIKTDDTNVPTSGLPYELQRVVGRYPVTLYSGNACSACDAGRQMLRSRGIPFIEKTVATADDVTALAKLENTDQLPVLRIGRKQLLGFSQTDWNAYLDAAGYPAESTLPPNYQWPDKAPLAPPAEVKGGDKAASQPDRRRPAPRVEPPPNNAAPPGFRF
jgi:glutaredoxin